MSENDVFSGSNPMSFNTSHFKASGELSDNNKSIVEQLDNLQMQIESMRVSAAKLGDQRDSLTQSLTELAETSNQSSLTDGHREEIQANIERLMQRVLTVHVKVEIPRTKEQEDAYQRVKSLLSELHKRVNAGLNDYRQLLNAYLNACSSESTGPVDSAFQQVMLACTIDDQKQVRKVLNSWIEEFKQLHQQWIDRCKNNMSKLD